MHKARPLARGPSRRRTVSCAWKSSASSTTSSSLAALTPSISAAMPPRAIVRDSSRTASPAAAFRASTSPLRSDARSTTDLPAPVAPSAPPRRMKILNSRELT